MGSIASINFEKTRNDAQLFHNDRTNPPNYLLPVDRRIGFEVNRSGVEARALRQQIIDEAFTAYVARVKQKVQAKNYLQSAVINLTPHHTMQDVERVVKHFEIKYGFQCYQIAIHRDEGHIDEQGNTQINHHAHLEFVTLDKHTGKNNFKRVSPFIMSCMQTEVAQILGMQRGERKNDYFNEQGELVKGTGRKRIKPRAYAELMEKAKYKYKKDLTTITNPLFSLINLFAIDLNKIKREKSTNGVSFIERAKLHVEGIIEAVTSKAQTLEQDKQEAEGLLADLINVNLPEDKRLTAKQAKPIVESFRKLMKEHNASFDELKYFIQEDYIALGELKKGGMTLKQLKESFANLERNARERYKKLQAKNATQIKGLRSKVSNLENAIADRNTTIDTLKGNLNKRNKAIQELNGEITRLEDLYETYKDGVEWRDKKIKRLEATNSEQAQSITDLQNSKPKEVYITDNTALENAKREYKQAIADLIENLKPDLTEAQEVLKEVEDNLAAFDNQNAQYIQNLLDRITELEKAPQTQEVPRQEDNAPNPLQEPYDKLNEQYEALKLENARIAQELTNLKDNLPILQGIGDDLANAIKGIILLAEQNPQEAINAINYILSTAEEQSEYVKAAIALEAMNDKENDKGTHK
ncbi:hypothetical protein NHP21005_20190 (plasmid) [Helicobacter sp. NHP21005]|uniref:hypothetical protein n=1 Tax=Helicobacter felistomachi TaxID=3040201 RepID=UPI002572B59B|nr:hypothetical protein [Helicobacter sp. NHP21005]BEG58331.1 hypothetical protein NHP21005_20190 [Helicobacter sp. NHP21005]